MVVGAVDHRSGLERGVSGQIEEWDNDEGMLPTSLPLTDDVFGGGGGPVAGSSYFSPLGGAGGCGGGGGRAAAAAAAEARPAPGAGARGTWADSCPSRCLRSDTRTAGLPTAGSILIYFY